MLYAFLIFPVCSVCLARPSFDHRNDILGGSYRVVADDPGLTECATVTLDE
jgi:hypothetical protein